MTDDSDSPTPEPGTFDSLSDEQKSRLLQDFIKNAVQNGSSNPSANLTATSSDGGAVKMMEMNPELILLVYGQEYGIRYCNTSERLQTGDHQMRLHLPGITADGPAGIQRQIPQSVTLYMSLDEFYKKITGDFVVDLREYCIRPDVREYLAEDHALGLPEMGERMPDGTVYVGRSPDNDKLAMFAEPECETLRANFRGAKRYARKRSLETGQNYRIPSRNEWEQIIEYRRLTGGKALGGYNKVYQTMDGWYWTRNATSLFNAIIAAPATHQSHRYSKGVRARRVGVRLIRYVPVESFQRKPETEEKQKLKLKLHH